MQRRPVREQQSRTNAGAEARSASRAHNPTIVYEIDGEIRWLDDELSRIVVHVADANRHAGALRGNDVTFGIGDAKVTTEDVNTDGSSDGQDLLPGVLVRVRARLPRSLDGGVPELIEATSVATLAPPAA